MRNPLMTTGDALRLTTEDGELRQMVYRAILVGQIKRHHHDRCIRLAAQLWASGWLERQRQMTGNGYGAEEQDDAIKRATREAQKELSRIGLCPNNLFRRFRWQWQVKPFLEALFWDLLFDGD